MKANNRRGLVRSTWKRVSTLGALRPRILVGLGAAALAAGFSEALLIFFVIRIALAMSAEEDAIALPSVMGGRLGLPAAFALAAGLLGLQLLFSFFNAALTARMSTRATDSARRATMEAFLLARYDVQAAERPSRLQELLSAHVTRISAAAMTLAVGLSGALSFAAFVVSAVVVTPYAVLIIVLGAILFGCVVVPLTRLTRRRSQRQVSLNTAYATSVSQAVGCAKETRVFGVTNVVRDALADQSRSTAEAGYQTRFLARITPVVYQSVAWLILVLCLAAAYTADVGGIGDLSAVVVLLVRAISYGQQVNTAIQQAGEVAPYLADVLASEEFFRAARAVPGSAATPILREITFRDVAYSYPTGEEVLHDLSFTVRTGQTVGIVGPSGSGKSTLVQLLLRLREPTRGTISVNGLDVRDFDYASWFHHVSLVPQDNVLLPGTIADNIRFYRQDISDEDIVEAACAAHLHELVTSTPAGYQTRVGPGHQDLSGGQRQRLGLARSFLRHPDVIILDEPTSALDMDSELLVQETLQSMGRRVTMFIVAHRLSTLANCDAVMVLEAGRLVAFGDHSELLAANAFYNRAVQLSGLQP